MSRRKSVSFPALLWDMLSLPKNPPRQRAATAASTAPPRQRVNRKQLQYDALVRTMKQRHGIRVNRWRSSTSGCAWQIEYHNGSISRLIEAPYPRGPVSAAVFLHEVGHHAIGFYRYKPRCYEEYMAWMWALQAMRDHHITITPRVEKLVEQCLRYAVAKARRRSIKKLPVELVKYL